jgi:hypothetical protein
VFVFVSVVFFFVLWQISICGSAGAVIYVSADRYVLCFSESYYVKHIAVGLCSVFHKLLSWV